MLKPSTALPFKGRWMNGFEKSRRIASGPTDYRRSEISGRGFELPRVSNRWLPRVGILDPFGLASEHGFGHFQ